MISAKEIKKLRVKTGAGVMECREALLKAGGDEKKALGYLEEKGADASKRRAGREAKQGRIESYIHSGSRIGAILDIRSETDFVARTDDFKDLAKKICMQIASMNPKDMSELMGQPLIFDEKRKVKDLVDEVAAKTGEKIEIKRFERYEVGEE